MLPYLDASLILTVPNSRLRVMDLKSSTLCTDGGGQEEEEKVFSYQATENVVCISFSFFYFSFYLSVIEGEDMTAGRSARRVFSSIGL